MNARPVLVIDSDGEWCERICRFLAPHGIAVLSAADVDAAAECIARAGKPGAVLLDSAAQTRSAVSSRLRGDADLRDVPVGYLKKTAALDALLLMLGSSATVSQYRAA